MKKLAVLFVLLVALFFTAEASDEPVDAGFLWERYRSELVRFLTRGNAAEMDKLRSLQLLQNGVEVPPENFDRVLEFCPKWGYLMDYSADKFHTVYRDFLNDLVVNPVSPSLMAQLDPVYKEIEKVQDQLLEAETTCYAKWNQLSDSLKQARFSNDFNKFKTSLCRNMVTLEEQSRALSGKIEYMMRNLSDRKTYLATTATNKYSLYSGDKNFIQLNSYQSFVDNMRAGNLSPWSVKIDESTSYTSESFYGRTSGFNLIIISYSSMKKEAKLTTKKKEFRMEISGKGLGAISVAPSKDWFTSDVIPEWRHGPFRSSENKWFNGGSMTLVPKTLYFVYQPKVTMYLNKEDTENIERSSASSFAIGLGFLSFNFGKTSSFKKQTETNNLWKVEIESTSTTPQLIAVAHTVY